MRKELDDKLCEKYPRIFKNRHGDVGVTAMCWGFECGDGWYNIIDHLCSNIEHHIKWVRDNRARVIRRNRNELKYEYDPEMPAILEEVPPKVEKVVAVQVKSKFGGLRFYYNGGDEFVSGLVQMAESMSVITCENCGMPANIKNLNGWWTAKCDNCISDLVEKE